MKRKDIIYGVRPIIEALETGKEMEKIMVQRGAGSEGIKHIMTLSRKRDIQIQIVPFEKLQKITTANHQGVIAFVSAIEYQDIFNLVPGLFESGETPFILVLDRITDVRNFGAICRTAECAGVHAVVIPAQNAAQINEDAIKTSAGAISRIPICRHKDLKEVLQFLQESGISIFGLTEKAKTAYHSPDFTIPMAVVLGNEGEGISREYFHFFTDSLAIPMVGEIQSLNVSVANGILLFEVLRQRTK